MKYSDFLDKMTLNSIGVSMKDSANAVDALRNDIKEPEFFS
jgi:hypothetical protein